MSYRVTIFGKVYELPPRTLSADDKIEQIKVADKEYEVGEKTRRELMTQMLEFVENFAPNSMPDIEEVDTNDLFKAVSDIILTYDEPSRKVRVQNKMAEARELLESQEAKKVIEYSKRVKK